MYDRPLAPHGGGSADKGDDHIYQKEQLVRFLREQAATPEGKGGRLELYFNGDFLEFAQTNQAAFSLTSDRYWCTQDESLAKLETIIAGHADIFGELGRFQRAGSRVTIAAGNHDVDLYWPQVQQRLRQAAGANLRFELGHEWVARHGGKLQIGHGHMSDPANRFEHWGDPISCRSGMATCPTQPTGSNTGVTRFLQPIGVCSGSRCAQGHSSW